MTRTDRLPRLLSLLGLLVLLLPALAGCQSAPPIASGESFRIDVVCKGGARRVLLLDFTADFGSPVGREIALTDLTSIDDDANSQRKIRIEGLRAWNPPRAQPTHGHIELGALASRPIAIVFEYKGHEDVYHLIFPVEGGVVFEPTSGEFTRVFLKSH